ncbi:acyl-CoA 6-desaturase-like isoform X2 [Tubulanus polymorphus]|uniref:acyl-CoA 6-desaturase-like isoform X2 n=1 Tax=Tubulanus polymorphus TaxID=672921 RepID=UPI003DA3A183
MVLHQGTYRFMTEMRSANTTAKAAWIAFHDDKDHVKKFLKSLLIGELKETEPESEISQDFRELRKTAEEMQLFKTNIWFYLLHIVHILLLELLAYAIIVWYGTSWFPYISAALLLTVVQAQAGWSQHDYGHLSVFPSSKLNHLAHEFVIGTLKGASSHWWNFRHFQHHAKPNVMSKDPDINIPYMFLLGDKMPINWAKKKKGFMPYQRQHEYFFGLGPPLLLPVYFHYENLFFIWKRKNLWDFMWMMSFFVKHFSMYGPLMGGWGAFWFYMLFRTLESNWFVWVTQMNHIPMDIDKDTNREWLTLQLKSTCNVDPGLFNDWFTGHLNFQIEHHLFPTMPRHNYHKIQPLVKSICHKHNLDYQSKSLFTAFSDIVRSLKKSGELWYDAYHMDISSG